MEEFKLLFPEFCILTLSVFLFLGVIAYYKLYRKSMCVFYLIILTELYTPACYYILANTTDYLKFTSTALRHYMIIGVVSLLSYSVILFCVQQIHFPQKSLTVSRLSTSFPKSQAILDILVLGTIVLTTAYIFYFKEKLPLYQAVFGGNRIERPDISGSIPHWFTVSSSIYIGFPCFYLYYHQKKEIKLRYNLIFVITLSIYMILGGNKGMVVYWFLFLWVYIWKMRIDRRIIGAGFVSIAFTAVIMRGGLSNLNFGGLLWALSYGFGRFFLTQGAMFVNRFEMILQGYPFSFPDINIQVFSFIYETDGGGAPTYYLGNLLIQYGYVGGFLIHLLIFAMLTIVGRYLDCQEFSEYKTYLFFLVQYFLGMAEISKAFVLRLVLIISLAILLDLLGRQPTALKTSKNLHDIPGGDCLQRLDRKSIQDEEL